VRFHAAAIEEIALHLAQMIEGERCLYQALWTPRPCPSGICQASWPWLAFAGRADIGWSNSLGW